MPIHSSISTDSIVVEPGATAPLTIDVENTEATEDQIEISIEGIDGDWIAIPVPTVRLGAGERQAVKVFFKPIRTSESTAGNFPFVARVRSLSTGDSRTAQGMLTIKPFVSVTAEVNPKKGFVTPTKSQNIFALTLMNLGNSEQQFQLSADDPEDACAYEFDEETVTLAPGQQRDVDFVVNPKQGSPFGSTRLIGFAVNARGLGNQGVAATSQAQLEVRPFLTPLSLSTIVGIGVVATIFWFTQPKPPSVRLELVSAREVFKGDKVEVHWVAEHATSVKLVAGGETIRDNLPPEGSEEIEAPLVGTLRVQAVAFRDSRSSDPSTINVTVKEPPVIPEPEIIRFSPANETVNKGEKITLNYKFGPSVVKAYLSPQNIDLNLNVNSILVDPATVGWNEFTLVAENTAKKLVKKVIRVNVLDPCLAKIVKFSVDPLLVDPAVGKVTLNWQVTTAVRVELSYTGAKTYTLEPVGSTDIPIIGKTTFTLKAFDVNGKSITQSVTVDMKKEEIPPNDPAIGPPTTGTTAGTNPPTTGTTGR